MFLVQSFSNLHGTEIRLQKYIAMETLQVFAPLAKLLGMHRIKVHICRESNTLTVYVDLFATLEVQIASSVFLLFFLY